MKKRIVIMILVMTLVFVSSAHCARSARSAQSEQKWKEHRARHFYIYYKDAPKGFVKSVEDAAEDYYDKITKNLGFTRYKGWSFDDRAKIYIYADQEDYVNTGKQAQWSHGVANARKKTIRTFPSAHGFFDSILPHELGHIIFREFIGFRSGIPAWMDEGVAMFQEKAQRWGSDKAVKKAITDGRFISVKKLSRMRLYKSTGQDVIQLYYDEAASIVYYIIVKLGKQRFVSFCRKLRDGQSFQKAFFSVYRRFKTLTDLDHGWTDYLGKR